MSVAALRAEARALFDAGLRAADPGPAVRRAIEGGAPAFAAAGGRRIVVSVGKAGVAMAQAALRALPSGPVEALVVTNDGNARPLPGATVLAAGHPVPDARGAEAADRVEALLRGAGAGDRVIALISGGGSALLPAPVPGVSLRDKGAVTRLMLAAGMDITAMNAVRQHLSRLKGGGFLRAADPAPVTALILSDVIGDDLRVIASGPTVAPIATAAEVAADLRARGLWDRLPPAVRAHLDQATAAPPLPPATNVLIGSNGLSLAAMARAARRPGTRIAGDRLTGDVAEAAAAILAAARTAPRPACLLWGGETTVTLRGRGLGGRNQELALRVALAGLPGDWAFLSGGTDGRDGPTAAAGGIVDGDSAARMRAAGIDPAARLADNDSHTALAASGDLLVTGATGTNVADLQVLVLG